MNQHLKDERTTRDIDISSLELKEIKVNGRRENNSFKKPYSNNTMGSIFGVKTSRISLIDDKSFITLPMLHPHQILIRFLASQNIDSRYFYPYATTATPPQPPFPLSPLQSQLSSRFCYHFSGDHDLKY